MKIGITCYPVVGGSGIIATELGLKLADRGHQVHFITYAIPFRFDKFRQNLFYHGVETTAYPLFKHPPYTLALASKMAQVASQNELDILHVHYAVPHATCAFLAKQMITCCLPKVITTLHGTDITLVGSDPSYYDITKFSINSSDGITAVSSYLADETKDVFKIDKNIEVIPNFFDDSRFNPSAGPTCTRKNFASDSEFLITHISNFRPVKRTIDVIDIFAKISKKLPAKLLLIGEGPDVVLVRRKVTKLNLNGTVQFLGNQSAVEEILPLSDLFLLPSEEESFGLAALEALACGVPVIGTTGNGLVEVIEDNINGFLRPVGDTTAMADIAIELLTDKPRLQKFRESAAKISHKKFNADKIVTQYEQYYEKILNG